MGTAIATQSRMGDWKYWLPRVVLALAVVALFFSIANSTPEATHPPVNAAIESEFPHPDELDLRQTRVGLDLAATYNLVDLKIDNTLIPEDQIQHDDALNEWTYTPGVGTETGAMEPGRHCAVAHYRQVGVHNGTSVVSWCFSLH